MAKKLLGFVMAVVMLFGLAVEGAAVSFEVSVGPVERDTIIIDSGTISGELKSNSLIWILGDTVVNATSLSAPRISIDQNAVVNVASLSAPNINVRGNAQLILAENGTVDTETIEVESPATINFENKLQNCILIKSKPPIQEKLGLPYYSDDMEAVWTVIGDAKSDSHIWISKREQLIIPEGAKLTVPSLSLLGGKIILDGELFIQDLGETIVREDSSVAGKNAKALRDTIFKNGKFSSSLITTIHNELYQYIGMILLNADSGPIMQFILRCMFYLQNLAV